MQVMNTSSFESTTHTSTLKSQSVLKPLGKREKKIGDAGLVLTSLIDCFVILVTYLLMAASIGIETLELPKDMQLPQAYKSETLEKGIVLLVHDGQYFLDNQPVQMDQIGPRLVEMKKTMGENTPVIIQADKRTNFLKLNPLVLAGLQAGFSQIRFAVKQEGGF